MKMSSFQDSLAQRRVGAFAPADHRGNNPHGTREQHEAEGKRLNAMRYETIGQAERAMDARAASVGALEPPTPAAGPGVGLGLLGWALLGAGALWLLTRGKSEGEGEGDVEGDDGFDALPLENPAADLPLLAPAPHITVNVAPTVNASPALAPEPAAPLPAVKSKPKRRHRSKKEVEVSAE